MKTFKGLNEAISTELLLWKRPSTRVAVEDCYTIKVYPLTSILNGPITFDIPPQQTGMLWDIDIHTTFAVMNGKSEISKEDNVSIINNVANAMWELVEVTLADRVDIMQSMRNSYAYQSYFNIVLNTHPDRSDYLFETQLFKMDSGQTKGDSETLEFISEEDDAIKNEGASERTKRIQSSDEISVSSKLHCPLITSYKALPPNLPVKITLTKNGDDFLLLAPKTGYTVKLSEVYLKVKFIKPIPKILSLIEERLAKEAAPYHISKPELIVRPITQTGRVFRMNHIFTGKLPHHAFFCVQKSDDFDGKISTNPFAFVPFNKFQLHIDGKPYFSDALESKPKNGKYTNNAEYLNQLYESLGLDIKGQCLITSKNFEQNFIVGVSLAKDRVGITPHGYISPQYESSTQLEIDLGSENSTEGLILIVYAVYDRLVKIHGDRSVEIIE